MKPRHLIAAITALALLGVPAAARADGDPASDVLIGGRIFWPYSVKVPAKSGQSGRLFGAVSNGDIAAAVKAAGGPELDKRKIEVKQAIKTLGSYEATVRLHPEVAATLTFEVVSA